MGEEAHARDIATRSADAGNESGGYRVGADRKDDRDGRGCSACGQRGCRPTAGENDRDLLFDQLRCHRLEPIILVIGPAIFDCEVLALDVAGFGQAFAERGYQEPILLGCRAAENADNGSGLLRAQGLRTDDRCRRPTESQDELATLHSITSSARASSLSGTVRPSAFAVLRLTTVSNLVGACTGRSAGFSPLRMRSMYDAACRNCSRRSAPYEIRPPAETNRRSQ